MASWFNLHLHLVNSPLMEQLIFSWSYIIHFSNNYMVSYLMLMLFFNNFINRFLLQGQTI